MTTLELRQTVLKHLQQEYGGALAERYRLPASPSATLLVRKTDGDTTPFSRSEHRRTLECCGLSADDAAAVTACIYDHLVNKGTPQIASARLGRLTYRYLRREVGADAAKRYLVWIDFLHSDRPLLLLIGGTAGSGKSTLATKLTHRIEKTRVQSTDMLREVMRMLIPERLLPALHTSSFNAWQTLATWGRDGVDDDALLTEGYRAQAELVAVACEAVIQRALKERISLILEGVHVLPSLLSRLPDSAEAVVVPIMLAILKPAQLGKLIQVRGRRVPDRRSERYFEHFDAIWRLQTFLLSEADRAGIPIISNDNEERVIGEIMSLVIEALSRDFSATPKEVFL